jgi:hypothetical protein
MVRFTSPLDNVKIAAPCSADWDLMIGTDRMRFCQQCQLNVYNLSGMSRKEAEDLIAKSQGRVCVRFYRRADGTILTQNCPVGLRALKRRVSRAASAIFSAALSFLAGFGIYTATREKKQTPQGPLTGMVAVPQTTPMPRREEALRGPVMGEFVIERPARDQTILAPQSRR